ncbi:MAG: restriction endonuclease [Bacteroidales bacterium]|nr:restriction endonuclease [Bacteroidales bacterium]
MVQVLNDKLTETGSQKGILVSSSGFQKGAIAYAKRKGIALVRILRVEMLYETKGGPQTEVNIQEIKGFFDLPDFSFLQIIGNEENRVTTPS